MRKWPQRGLFFGPEGTAKVRTTLFSALALHLKAGMAHRILNDSADFGFFVTSRLQQEPKTSLAVFLSGTDADPARSLRGVSSA